MTSSATLTGMISGDAPKSAAHRIMLAFVWVTMATGAIVFTEPSPYDLFGMAALVVLPAVGLIKFTQTLLAYVAIMLIPIACAFLAVLMAIEPPRALTHTTVTLFLTLISFVIAAFVVKAPERHARLVLNGFVAAGLLAAGAGLAGYLNLFPGAYDIFTLYGRVSGTFKDPNVFGAFLVLPAVYLMHRLRAARRGMVVLALTGVGALALGILLSFSRGAWFNLAAAMAVFAYFSYVTASNNMQRLRILGCVGGAVLGGSLLVAVALQFDVVAELLSERATLTQSYDVGPEGRFGGQAKAKQLILAHPLGLGAQQFDPYYHLEEAHNVYLSMFMNAGWLGGLIFATMIGLTCLFGARHALKKTATQSLFLVAYAALVAHALEGFVIDLDHWRHFHLLMALVWGLMLGDRIPAATAAARAMELSLRVRAMAEPRRQCAAVYIAS